MPLDAGMLCHTRRGGKTVRLTKSMCIDEMSRKCNKLQAMHPPSPLAHFPFSSLFIYFFELSHTIYLFRLQLGMDSLGNSSINHTEYAKESRKALHAVPSCAYVCMCVFINEGRKIKIPAAIFRSQCHYSCNVFDRRTDGRTDRRMPLTKYWVPKWRKGSSSIQGGRRQSGMALGGCDACTFRPLVRYALRA